MRNPFSSLMLSSGAALVSLCALLSPSWPHRFPAADSSRDFAIRANLSKPTPAPGLTSGLSKPDELTKRSINQAYGKLPLQFIENRGQVDSRVAYYAQNRNTNIYFAPEGITIGLTSAESSRLGLINPFKTALSQPAIRLKSSRRNRAKQRWALKLDFIGSNPDVKPKGVDRTASVVNYFKGSQSKSGLRTYTKLIYENLWPNIDLLYASDSNRLKYTFVVRPGGDINQIKLACRGATSARVNHEGRLQIDTPLGSIEDDKPYSYQYTDGQQINVATGYEIEAESDQYVYGFRAGSYDRSKTLVIDPVVLVYCGYVGGDGEDIGSDIAVDSDHNAYITGSTDSTEDTFPVTAGPDLTYNGDDGDAFVAKINPEGSALIYCSYIGGSDFDEAVGIAVDSTGSAYVFGDTHSDQSTFPVKVGPDLTYNGSFDDAFVAKIDPTGSSLIYCGYIGGSGCESASGIAVDNFGNAYVAGDTTSNESSFPVIVGPDLTYNNAGGRCGEDDQVDAFVAKINAIGTALLYCGYIGGSGTDETVFGGMTIDDSGSIYVTGRTDSDESTFPVKVGPDLTYNGGNLDVFVAKVNASGETLDYCGYIGGSDQDGGIDCDIAVDRAGNAYVTGDTTSPQSSFPLIVGPDLKKNSHEAAFVARVKASGESLDYCGYIEGKSGDFTEPGGIAADADGNAYVFGSTSARETNFPVTLGPDLTYNGGSSDIFVAKINPAGTSLIYCGYIGGGNDEFGDEGGIAVDDSGNAYVVGETISKESSFPVTVGPGLEFSGGDSDTFVAKIAIEQEFALRFDRPVISIARGDNITIKIHVDRDPGFSGRIKVKSQDLVETGLKFISDDSKGTSGDSVKFKMKAKNEAVRGARRIFFTGSSPSGVEHTSAVTIIITR